MKTPINIQRIHKDTIITFYCAEETKWVQAQITLLGLNFVKLTALEGNLEGFKWSASMTEIQDPDFYRPYIPEPPKRKKKGLLIFSNKLIVIYILVIIILILAYFLI